MYKVYQKTKDGKRTFLKEFTNKKEAKKFYDFVWKSYERATFNENRGKFIDLHHYEDISVGYSSHIIPYCCGTACNVNGIPIFRVELTLEAK